MDTAIKKTRIDAWGADLPEEKLWEIYDLCRALPYPTAVIEQLEQLGCVRLPTRAAWYRFLARMRKADADRRIEKMAAAVAEAQQVADKAAIKDKVFIETLKTLAIDRAMGGDDKSATALAGAAATIWDRAQKRTELELKERAQNTRDEQLRLAREKFEAAEKRLAAMAELSDAARGGKVDPAKVADEIDRILGRKK